MPAGSITFLPKIHGPVSTTIKLWPTSYVASSTLPMPPSRASTEKPARLRCEMDVSVYVQRSLVVIVAPFRPAWYRSSTPLRPDITPAKGDFLAALERCHREPEAAELVPVELRRLAMPRPDDRATGVVDLVCHSQASLVGDVRDGRRERSCDALEGVVVVVEDDHVPRGAEAGARAPVGALLRRRRHDRIVVASGSCRPSRSTSKPSVHASPRSANRSRSSTAPAARRFQTR